MSEPIAPDGWVVRGGRLVSGWRATSYLAGLDLLTAIGQAADAAAHHPDLGYGYPGIVRIALVTHDAGDTITDRDTELARTISRLAADHGAELSEP